MALITPANWSLLAFNPQISVNNCIQSTVKDGGQVFLKAWLHDINASLPWKWWASCDARESQLRQPVLIFIDNMLTGVLFNHFTTLRPLRQLSLAIFCNKPDVLAILAETQLKVCAGDFILPICGLGSCKSRTIESKWIKWDSCQCSERGLLCRTKEQIIQLTQVAQAVLLNFHLRLARNNTGCLTACVKSLLHWAVSRF